MYENKQIFPVFSKTMRKMWVQFAKTGNPSLPAELSPDGKAKEWPLYDTENKEVMVLEENNIHTAKEADLKIVDWKRTYFLTNYYLIGSQHAGGFEGTDIAYGNPTSKTLMPAGGILGKAESEGFENCQRQ